MNPVVTISKQVKSEESCTLHHHKQINDPGNMSDHDLLATFFAFQLPRERADLLAGELLAKYTDLRGMLNAAEGSLHNGQESDQQWMEIFLVFGEIFTRHLREGLQRGTPLTSPADTLDYLQRSLQGRRREVFQCMFLDTRHRMICHEELFQGSIDGACVYPRVVAEHALRHNAAAVIVAHNHPSGVTEPSLADQAITRRLKDALGLLEIRLLDHFVIGDGTPVSMAARGML